MNIRVNLNYPIQDGTEVVFRSPVDCSRVTGLIVYYPGASHEFMFADAHGNNVGDIDHLFAENVVVKVILDVTTSMAFVQNADTNAYIESTFIKSVNGIAPDENGNVQIEAGEGAVRYTEQKLTPGQQAQAQANIGIPAAVGELIAYLNENYSTKLAISEVYYALEQHAQGNAEDFTRRDERITALETAIGDISAALDELHAYAETLKGGEAG